MWMTAIRIKETTYRQIKDLKLRVHATNKKMFIGEGPDTNDLRDGSNSFDLDYRDMN